MLIGSPIEEISYILTRANSLAYFVAFMRTLIAAPDLAIRDFAFCHDELTSLCKISTDCVMSSWSGLWSTSPVNQGLPWSRAPPFVRQTTRSHIALYNFTLYFCTQQQVAKHTCVLVYHRCISICIYICFCICTVSTYNINSRRPLVLVQH